MGEALGVIDPRTIYHNADSELLALWMAQFELKREVDGVEPPDHQPGSTASQPRIIDHQNVDQQVNVCERLLL